MKDRAILENMNPFDDETSRRLFDVMDQLHSCGVERELDIPQLVIVGGQSTGKSSLLQSLTDIPFPVGAGCCTRFPTRIVSRRAPPGSEDTVTITIEAPDVDREYFEYPEDSKYKTYSYTSNRLSVAEFERIIEEISSEYMGIKCGKGPGKKNFATEILRIELFGPSQSHFSILDLPGIFSNPFSVNDFEMDGIKKTIADYMNDIDNIVICVADATSDLANQEIFKMASDLVEKERFIGVFTKCDLVQNDTEIVQIASQLGDPILETMCEHDRWFVARSRSERDDEGFNLQKAETMLFDKPPWNKLRDDRRGSFMLKKYLATLLCSKMRSDFPTIQHNIQKLLGRAKHSREALGDARASHHLRQLYLRDAVERFHAIAKKSLDRPGHLSDRDMMVRSHVRESIDFFTESMRERGHVYEFEDVGIDPAKKLADTISSYYDCDSIIVHHPATSKKKTDQQRPTHKIRRSSFNKHIKSQLKVWQTTQLPGLLNTEVVEVLFKEQTMGWEHLAELHINRVDANVESVCDAILKQVFASDRGSKTLRPELATVLEHFISDVNGPLLGLSTDWVLQLTSEAIDEFGREDAKVIRERARLDDKIRKLLAATNIVENFRALTPELEDMDD
ncbi:hypothetical protein KHU50_001208 [Colletotrichum sp. SAR 10_65]|nr:hypothetical protein KHU50_001208 [Colletotrichum sp. SAR 10_65]